jgi:membrane dipeptidase
MDDPTPQRAHGPWVDVHSHPGCGFLGGLQSTNPMVRAFGPERQREKVTSAARGEVAVVNVSTVADLAVLGVGVAGPTAMRAFEPGEVVADHRRQIAAISAVLEHNDVAPVLDPSDIEAAHGSGRTGVFLGCEGADFLEGEASGLDEAFEVGVRVITLVHYRVNELGDIQTEQSVHGGLTAAGVEILGEMNRIGIIADLAHATFATTVDAIEASTAPIMISHSHLASAGADHPRLLTEQHARVVADGGGLIGAWPSGVACTSLADYSAEVCRLIDLVGVDHVAIGTDMDANYRPVLTSYAQFPELAALLADRGLTHGEIDAVLGGNFIRLFEAVEHACA